MKVTVKRLASLRKDRFQEAEIVQMHSGETVRDLLAKLMIDTLDIGILVINARRGTFDQILFEGDKVTIIPPIDGG